MSRVEIRMTAGEHEALDALARAAGQKMAGYIRAAINAHAGEEVLPAARMGRPWPPNGEPAGERLVVITAVGLRDMLPHTSEP